MNAKRYLMRIETLLNRCRNLGERIEYKRIDTFSLGSPDTSKENVMTSKENAQENKIINFIDLSAEASEDIKMYKQEIYRMIKQIHSLDNSLYEHILYERYVNMKRFTEIADEMGYSYDWITHMHGDALKAFGDKFLNTTRKNKEINK